jgi:hypothetical protein
MLMIYATQEFYDAVKEKANSDERYLKKAKGLTIRFQNLLMDCPGDVDKLIDWGLSEGKVESVKLQESPAPSAWRTAPLRPDYFLRTIASYETYVKLNKKEISPEEGQASGAFRIMGNLSKIMAKIATFTTFTDLIATIPAEYE